MRLKSIFTTAAIMAAMPSIAAAEKVVSVNDLLSWIQANQRDEAVVTPPPTEPPPTTGAAPSWSATGWTSVFSDDFNDLSKWCWNWLGNCTSVTKPVNSAELAAYDPKNCTVVDGILQMRAERRSVVATDGKTYSYATCGGTTSGKLPDVTYGAFEARILFPGPATGPSYNFGAWWLNGRHSSWPDRGENDIVETLSGGLKWHYHWKPNGGSDINKSGGSLNGANTWHTFGVEWTATQACYYYDAKPQGCATVSDPNPKYLVLDYGVASRTGGPLMVPATMMVDWVRAWKKT